MSLGQKKIEEIVSESIDLHVHVGPDVLPRKYTIEQLVAEEEGHLAGFCPKTHSFPPAAYVAEYLTTHTTKMKIMGSVTLNYFIGGFNSSAVYAASQITKGPVMVWFPTVHAENHLKRSKSEFEIPPDWVKDPNFIPRKKTELKSIRVTDWNNRIFEKCDRVLSMMERMGCILATGHLSAEEGEVLILEALRRGIPSIYTHVIQRDVVLPVEQQKKIAAAGAIIEHSYIVWRDRDNPGDYPFEEQVRQIHEVGPKHCILSSDCGQKHNPPPSQCLAEYIEHLTDHGLKEEDVRTMLIDNPRRIMERKWEIPRRH
ncbi:Uncharacterised protein [uncultured archaeon]|nr:Uncharacterised protein [uncultured archaeon]